MNSNKHQINYWFFGSDTIAANILSGLLKNPQFNLLGVVTSPPRYVGRKQILTRSIVAQRIENTNIAIFEPEILDQKLLDNMIISNPNIVIVCSYGKFISKRFLDKFENKFINIHGSKLPLLRGATPIQSSILLNYPICATVQVMSLKMDEGDVLDFVEVKTEINDTHIEIREKMVIPIVNSLNKIIPLYLSNNINPQPQDDANSTYCYLADFTKDKSIIDFNKPSLEVHNKIRAFNPDPGAWAETLTYKGSKLDSIKILVTKYDNIKSETKADIGEVFEENGHIYIKCKDSAIVILKVLIPGKNQMNGHEYLNHIKAKK